MATDESDVTKWIHAALAGDPAAEEQLTEHLHESLRGQAKMLLSERGSVRPTELVNEVWIRVFRGSAQPDIQDRNAFLAYMARAMRSVIVDHSRQQSTQKRGGNMTRHPLDDFVQSVESLTQVDVLSLNEALEDLRKENEQLFRTVELRFFVGMTVKQVAEYLGISESAAGDAWALARAKLRAKLGASFERE